MAQPMLFVLHDSNMYQYECREINLIKREGIPTSSLVKRILCRKMRECGSWLTERNFLFVR